MDRSMIRERHMRGEMECKTTKCVSVERERERERENEVSDKKNR